MVPSETTLTQYHEETVVVCDTTEAVDHLLDWDGLLCVTPSKQPVVLQLRGLLLPEVFLI